MKSLLTLGIILLSGLGGQVWAQNACAPEQAIGSRSGFSNLAQVLPLATVVVSPGPIYPSATVTTPISGSTLTADQNGNYNICAAPGTTQTVTVQGVGQSTLIYQLTLPTTPIGLGANNTFSGNNTFTGTTIFNAPINMSNGGLFSPAQMNLYLASLVNNCNPTSEYHFGAGVSSSQTEGVTGCVTIPASAGSQVQGVGVQGYVNGGSASSPGIGVQGIGRSTIANASIHGGIFIGQDTPGIPDNNYYGSEDFLLVSNTTSVPNGHLIAAGFSAQPVSGQALTIIQPVVATGGVGPYFWPEGIRINLAATLAPTLGNLAASGLAIDFYPAAVGVNQPSQGEGFLSNDLVSGINLAMFDLLANGNMSVVTSKAGTGLQINGLIAGTTLNTGNGTYAAKKGNAGCTTAASIGGVCASPITVTWPVAFADTNYSVNCTPSGAPTNLPGTAYVSAKATGTVTVNYFAITAAAASWATIDCEATHD